jgi:hypothetical protein
MMPRFFALLALAATLGSACAHRAERAVVQHRELVGLLPPIPGERTHFAYAELQVDEEGEARLWVSLLAPDGSRQVVVHAMADEAASCAARLGEGATLAEALPPYMGVGLAPSPPPALPVTLGPPLEGMVLRLERLRDRRYPRTKVLLLESAEGSAELARFFVPEGAELELVSLTPDAAALAFRSRSPAGVVRDVRAVVLLGGARRLLVRRASRAIDERRLEQAAALLARAEILGAPEEGELWFEMARLHALSGAGTARVLQALSRAIPFEPALYRMRARTEPAFAKLKEDGGFLEAVAPRPIPGRDRAVQVISD